MKKDNMPEDQNVNNPQDEELKNTSGGEVESAGSSEVQEDGSLPVTMPDQGEMTDELAACLEEEEAGKENGQGQEADKAPQKKTREKKPKDPRKIRFGAMATALTVIVIAAVMLLNVVMDVLAERFPLTLDLTSDKTYSLTDMGIEVAKNLESDVEITVFMSEDFFQEPAMELEAMNTVLRQFYQMSREMVTQSGGKVSVNYVDLTKNPTLAQNYKEYEVTYGDILFVSGTRSKKVTVDDLIQYDGNQYYGYTYTSLVEQTLASGCNAVGNGETVHVTLLTGHKEDENALYALNSILTLNGYDVEEVDFTTAAEINEECSIIVIAGPTTDFDENEINRLRSWLSNNNQLGRNLLFYCNPEGSCPNLYGFLKEDYGIEVTSNLIQETDQNKVTLASNFTLLPIVTPESTDYTQNSTGKKVIFSNGLQLILHNDSDPETTSIQNIPILSFTDTAKLLPLSALDEEGNTSDKLVDADSYPVVGMAAAHTSTYVDNEQKECSVVVSGSLESILYYQASQYGNEQIIIDSINTMAGRENAVAISGKDLSAESLSYSNAVVNILGKGVFMCGIPLLMLVIGLIVFLRRRHL